jgi:hypothetical protein
MQSPEEISCPALLLEKLFYYFAANTQSMDSENFLASRTSYKNYRHE